MRNKITLPQVAAIATIVTILLFPADSTGTARTPPTSKTAVAHPQDTETSTTYLPAAFRANPNNPRKGVALAYGWQNGEDGADKLRTGTYMFWWLTPPLYSTRSGRYLPTFWSDCYSPSPGCTGKDDIWPDYERFVEYTKTLGHRYVNFDGRIAVVFANECDLPWPQCARPPEYMATVYIKAVLGCPHCVFFGPATSSKDHLCNWPPEQRMPFHDAIRHHREWCYWQQFWEETELLAEALSDEEKEAVMSGVANCAIHHYEYHPAIGQLSPPVPAEEFTRGVLETGQRLGCKNFIVAEYSACRTSDLVEITEFFNRDPRVVAFYAWTPNLPDTPGGTPCEVLLDWDTGELTELGEAFAGAANGR